MKQCPYCKANYNDDSLSFCLNDGTALLTLADEQETQVIAKGRITAQPNFSGFQPNNYDQPVQRSNNKTVFVLISIIALIGLIALGGVAAYFLVPQNKDLPAKTSPTPTPTGSNDEELKKKIANLEKQLQDQKKTPASTPVPARTPAPLNESGKATARVARTGDGFLALRSDPSVNVGRRLLEIPSGATVEIEDCQNATQTIDGRRGRWCMVSYNNTTGWAFDAWLIY